MVPISDCCDLIVDCVNKTAPTVGFVTPFRMIRTTNVRNGFIDLQDCKYVDEATYQKWTRRAAVQDGDVILTREAPIGQVGVVRGNSAIFLGQRLMQYRANRNVLDPMYLMYAFLSPALQVQFGAHEGSGSVVSHIRVGDCTKFQVPLPPLDEQARIAGILGALDERKLLLQSTNVVLEAIVQAIFKSWFIDFDPVHAKAEGREPEGMDAETAALFPSEFEESELGLIPKEWAVSSLGDHVQAERGLSYKGAGLCVEGEGSPMHNLNSVHEGGGYKCEGIKFYNGDHKEKHVAFAGDIILANTEQGHEHRLIGFPAIIPRRYPQAIYSHHLYRLRRRTNSDLTTHTLYELLLTPQVREQIIACTNGSTVNMLKPVGLEIPRFACPPAALTRAFDAVAAPIQAAIEANVERADLLTDLRDTLLPRLISGKLRVPEAQEAVEEALK